VITSNKKNTAPPVKVERGSDHMVIHPRNVLRAKAAIPLDGKPSMDETAIRRAEQALKALSINFNGWMEDAVRTLSDARDTIRGKGAGEGRAAAMHRAAHDIRGQATTFGFPLASRVGASLCMLLENCPPAAIHGGPLTALVDQHVDAVRAIVREGVTKAAKRTGETLAAELEAITEKLLASPSLH
jgi:HPt (histidine-containing phosphotransfer) domain-containing protein